MEQLVKEGVIAKPLPDAVVKRLREVTKDVLADAVAKDPLTKKVAESFVSAFNLLRQRTEGTDMPFLVAREKYIKYS